MRLHRPARRALLIVHITSSVSWLGITLGLLALGVTANTSGSAEVAEASYRSMKMFTDWLVPPLALTTFFSGLVLSLGTPWGLLQHRWVFTKFCTTLITLTLAIFVSRPEISHAAATAISGEPTKDADLIIAPSVALSTYVFLTVISVLKPWGLTKRGRRMRAAAGAPGGSGRSRRTQRQPA